MLIKNSKFILIIAIISLLSMDVFAGGGKRNGTGGAQELLIPVSARGLAMSGAYTSGITGIDAIFYNPAGLSISNNSAEAMFSYMNYIADINFSFAAVAVHFSDFGSLGFAIRTLDFGDIPVTTVDNPEGTGATFSPTYVVIGATYSNSLTDRIRVGFTANVVSEKILRSSATGVSFDAGIQYNGIGGVEGLKFGVALKNFGAAMSYDGTDLDRRAIDEASKRGLNFYRINSAEFELPSQLELGVAYERNFGNNYKGIISSSFQNNNFSNDEYRVAGEFSYDDLIFLRGGYAYVSEAVDIEEEAVFGPTFGVGLKLKGNLDVKVDYAYRTAEYFDANHMVTVQFGF
ncbi:MAG: PorV/PorQ family protein [Bacteroidetes bacterium]|nr:PorV/PorQ family protein [Bacteroidota bacterium]